MSAVDSSTSPRVAHGATHPRLVRWALAAAALGAAYAIPLIAFFQTLWAREHYQHFPFVLAAFGWLAVERWRAAERRPRRTRSTGAAVATIVLGLTAWALLAAAYAAPSPWLAYLSFIVLTGGACAAVQSTHRAAELWGAWAVLLVILPPPLNRDQALITMLQRSSSRTSSFVLDALGVDHLMAGNSLLTPDKQFFVDEACSGIISVASIIACAVIYAVWRRRSAMHTILLAVAGVGWATLMNTLRISAIATAHAWWGLDWTTGLPHQAISLCVFTCAFLALMSTDVLLAGLLAPIAVAWAEIHGEPVPWGRRLIAVWDALQGSSHTVDVADHDRDDRKLAPPDGPRLFSVGRRGVLIGLALAAFAALPAWRLLAGNAVRPLAPAAMNAAAQASVARALACDADALPDAVAGAQRVRFSAHERSRDDLLGMYSRTYEYRDPRGRVYLVSCDFPYEGGWHELTVCYQGAGWTLDDRRVRTDGGAEPGAPWEVMEADFSNPEGVAAFLAVCAFDEAGTPIPLPTMSLGEDLWKALTQREVDRPGVAFQVQVWLVSGGAIGDQERATVRELLATARDRFRNRIAADEQASASIP